MGAGIEPGGSPSHLLDVEAPELEVGSVDVGDLEFTASGRAYRPRDLGDPSVVKVQADHRIVGFRPRRLFLQRDRLALRIELDHAVPARVLYPIAKDGRAVGACGRRLGLLRDAVSVEQVVSQDQGDGSAVDERRADQERFSQPCGLRLFGIGNGDAELRAVPEQSPIQGQVVGGRDQQDLPNAGLHERCQRIVDHGLVVDRQKLLGYGKSQRIESRAGAACEDNALQSIS